MKIFSAEEIFANPNKTFEYQTTKENAENKEEIKIIGDVPSGAKVEINGLVVITADGQTIYFTEKVHSQSIINNKVYINNQLITGGSHINIQNYCVNLTITGNVKENAKISSEGGVTVDGDVEKGAAIETSNGKITAKTVHKAQLTTSNGSINVDTAHQGAMLETSNGGVKVTNDLRHAASRSTSRNQLSSSSSSSSSSLDSSDFYDLSSSISYSVNNANVSSAFAGESRRMKRNFR
ncbi:hypothetical protein [Candidatus Mesenet endosymbiont of Agriotes lineatus]|uniref:hypothetical protein n=1 Tax=Candidatus Mesenet endosymbiont of Agriotes lineatus TaxID=3077948 RepID=UPI0030CEA248